MPLAEPPARDSRVGSPLKLSKVRWVKPEAVIEVTFSLGRAEHFAAGLLSGPACGHARTAKWCGRCRIRPDDARYQTDGATLPPMPDRHTRKLVGAAALTGPAPRPPGAGRLLRRRVRAKAGLGGFNSASGLPGRGTVPGPLCLAADPGTGRICGWRWHRAIALPSVGTEDGLCGCLDLHRVLRARRYLRCAARDYPPSYSQEAGSTGVPSRSLLASASLVDA